jgi:uridine kinase
MNGERPKFIAIVGGSGAGKSWLANRMQQTFGMEAARLSLDDFYHDYSHVAASYRERINFDEPSAIDWMSLETVLRDCQMGCTAQSPRYDFSTHTRVAKPEAWIPRRLVFVEGLWLLWRPSVRAMFDFRVFLECPEDLRWRRRLQRDTTERGRTADSVREQFWNTVAPMHGRYVSPQMQWADMVLHQPVGETELTMLTNAVRELLIESFQSPSEELEPAHTT